MTDNEIIKALECHKEEDLATCANCPLLNIDGCAYELSKYALDLINRQNAEKEALIAGQETLQKYIAEQKKEIDRLQNDLAQTEDAYKTVHEMNGAYARKIDFAKAEAIKEFAEKIKQDAVWICDDSYIEDALREYVDNFVKEMVGEDNN
jgi:predicted RNase H-like nuclease (RuvC/YqgF family)